VIHTIAAVSSRPTTQAPNSRSCVVGPSASSGIAQRVMNQKPTSEITPATTSPLYSAGITFFMPGVAFTALQPMMDAMIENPPSTSG